MFALFLSAMHLILYRMYKILQTPVKFRGNSFKCFCLNCLWQENRINFNEDSNFKDTFSWKNKGSVILFVFGKISLQTFRNNHGWSCNSSTVSNWGRDLPPGLVSSVFQMQFLFQSVMHNLSEINIPSYKINPNTKPRKSTVHTLNTP